MSWTEIEIYGSGRVRVRRGGTLTGEPVAEPQPEPEPEPKLVTSWRECVRNHPWKIDDKPKHCYPIEPMPEPEPEPEPKPKLVTWRRCVPVEHSLWIESGQIPAGWVALEAHTQPVETVQQLPEGQQP